VRKGENEYSILEIIRRNSLTMHFRRNHVMGLPNAPFLWAELTVEQGPEWRDDG
jgi:hypothetical protein